MANSEKLIAIQKVKEALDAVMDAQASASLPASERKRLEGLELDLNAVHRKLTQSVTAARIEALKRASADLAKVGAKIDDSIAKLRSVAEKVETAAKAVEIAVKILELAAKLAVL
jgi:hypothetical protein